MASIPAPVSLPSPVTWWQDPKTRARLIAAAVLAAMYVAGLAYGSWTRVCAGEHCPSISRLVGSGDNVQMQTSKVFAADGRLISELGLERRTVLPLSEIPIAVRQAFLATEDKRFYSHHGIDYLRVLGALKANLLSFGYSQGFSTISMQLARNIFPDEISRQKQLTRKLKEARVAVEIERNFPKDTILQLYLNQINLGAGALGVEAAAQIYFGKHASQLNVAEAATLAALPKSPAIYNPRTHPERAVWRRNAVLRLMRDQGYLTDEEFELWQAYPLVLTTHRTNYGDVAPYFVEWLRVQLDARFGRDLYEGGLRIYTTLDLDMQEAAERALQAQLDAIEAGVYSNGKFPGRTTYREYIESSKATGEDHGLFTPYLQGALVALEANTGYIRAMIGGRDFDDSKYNRATQAIRQPGSTFKPFVYSAAVRAGHPVTEMLDDSPLNPPVIQLDSTPGQPKDDDDTTLGTRAEPIGILRVEDRQGNILWKSDLRREEVMDPEHAWLMVDMMKDVIRRGTAFSAVWKAGFTLPAAGKTGTTDDYTDAWFIGYTPELVAGMWVGYDIQQRILEHNAGGGRIVAPAWTAFMRDVYDRRPPPPDWERPDSLITREVDWSNGYLATPFCPQDVRHWDWFYPGTEPTQSCPVHTPFGIGVSP